jgi:hypothetical protein
LELHKNPSILTDNIIPQESQNLIHINLLNYIPKSFDYILNSLLAHSLIAESLNTRSSIRQNIWRLNSKASFIDAHPTAALTSVGQNIAHAALQSLRLTIRNTLSGLALSSFLANRSIIHWRGFRTIGVIARAPCFLFTSGVGSFPTLNSSWHELAILTTRRIFVATNSSLVFPQFTILIATSIIIFGTQQSSIALLIPFHSQIATERFLGLRKATPGLGLQNLPDRS